MEFALLALIVVAAVLMLVFGAEDRQHMKRIDVSKVRWDDGSWLSER